MGKSVLGRNSVSLQSRPVCGFTALAGVFSSTTGAALGFVLALADLGFANDFGFAVLDFAGLATDLRLGAGLARGVVFLVLLFAMNLRLVPPLRPEARSSPF